MSERWFKEHWEQLMGSSDELLTELRRNVEAIDSARATELLAQAEQQRNAAEHTFRTFSEQHQELMATLDSLQAEVAVGGRPMTGEVS